ncbi:hypothetical protein B0A48_13189 [Cryoendolithus antarcticus]|uniref:Uncharacterized protein n=1 Tax=Cryoendolithus antarcticus TaxID=1507870 RepID=A0A1V8SNK8_9PEZI|nr:hypothetical protein B0A48_13189 [Cryoendolithus antarcticus]
MSRRVLVRSVVGAAAVIFLILLFHIPDVRTRYNYLSTNEFIASAAAALKAPGHFEIRPTKTASYIHPTASVLPDKIVVIGRLQREDTDWVGQFLPEWQNAIYTVDNTSHALHTQINKGREANAYLSYIIENYDKLPATIAFVHSHRDGYPAGWHTDVQDYDNVISLQRLNIPFVQRNGYANLRCIFSPGCPDEVQPFRDPPKELELDGVLDKDPSLDDVMKDVWPLFFGNNATIPEAIGTPCCAQFAVSRDQIRKRSLAEYELYHEWLMATKVSDAVSGRVFEYLWHVIFGQGPVYCPELEQCYQDVYGIGHR